jgi:hypothetical protein
MANKLMKPAAPKVASGTKKVMKQPLVKPLITKTTVSTSTANGRRAVN